MNEFLYKLRPFMPYIILAILVFIVWYYLNKKAKRDNFITSKENTQKASQSKYMLINQATGEIMFSEANGATITNRITKMEDQLALILGTSGTGGLTPAIVKTQSTTANGWLGGVSKAGDPHNFNNKINSLLARQKQIMGDDFNILASGLSTDREKITSHVGNEGVLGKLRKRVEDVHMYLDGSFQKKADMKNYINHGSQIDIQSRGTHRLGDDQCDNSMNGGSEEKTRWCRASSSGHKMMNITIHKI